MVKKRVGANLRQKIVEKRTRSPEKKRRTGALLFNGLKIAVGISVIGFAGFWAAKKAMAYVDTADFLKIKDITVQGNTQASAAEVLSLASIEKEGMRRDVKVPDIREKLEKIAWIEKVRIRRRISGSMAITLYERTPVAIVNLGRVSMVDANGYLWPMKPGAFWSLPVISGLKDTVAERGRIRLNQEGVSRMRRFFADCKKVDGNILSTIAQVDFGSKDAILIRFESLPMRVALNSAAAGKSLGHLADILKAVEENSQKTPEYINLSYTNIAFVR